MAINGWEHHDLSIKISKANLAELLDIYKEEKEKYLALCQELVKHMSSLTEAGKEKFNKECEHAEEAMMKVSLAIADMLTDKKRA